MAGHSCPVSYPLNKSIAMIKEQAFHFKGKYIPLLQFYPKGFIIWMLYWMFMF